MGILGHMAHHAVHDFERDLRRAGARRRSAKRRQAEQRARDARRLEAALAKQAHQDAQRRELLAIFDQVVAQMMAFFEDVVRTGFTPRKAHQDAKLPVQAVRVFKTDQTAVLFKRAPRRSAIFYPLGVWFGEYKAEGRYCVLVEHNGQVQPAVWADSQDEADAVWSAIRAVIENSRVHTDGERAG